MLIKLQIVKYTLRMKVNDLYVYEMKYKYVTYWRGQLRKLIFHLVIKTFKKCRYLWKM